MPHFPSKLQRRNGSGSLPRHSDLNATQHRTSSHPIFSQIEEELHDARRVHSHGQQEDLCSALMMVIDRVSELSSLLNDAYKTQAELEVQLNVTKSNLQLVIANNEMLEDALKRDPGQSMDIGWRRTSVREGESSTRPSLDRSQSVRPKELEDLTAELEKERAARKAITQEKATLEDELESLSQALFEEANNMVATERRMRAETEEELIQLKQEKEALRSALRLIEGENTTLREPKETQMAEMIPSFSPPPSRSSSRMAVKSRPTSPDPSSTLPPLPPSPSVSQRSSFDEDNHPTPTTGSRRGIGI